jgi:plasmid stabilization system protein ParE
MAQVTWTAEAQLWLRDIHDNIAAENPAAAHVARLDETSVLSGRLLTREASPQRV